MPGYHVTLVWVERDPPGWTSSPFGRHTSRMRRRRISAANPKAAGMKAIGEVEDKGSPMVEVLEGAVELDGKLVAKWEPEGPFHMVGYWSRTSGER